MFVCHFRLPDVVSRHGGPLVVQGAQLLIQVRDLSIFLNHELSKLVDLFLGIARCSLVALEHSKETVDAFIACISQILHNLFAHFHLLLVGF